MWALDYQFDVTAPGRVIKILHVIDEFTRESLADLVDHSIDADATAACLHKIVEQRGRHPTFIRCNNGPELTPGARRHPGATYVCSIASMSGFDIAKLRRRLSLARSTYIPSRAAKVRQRYPAGHFYSPIPDLRDIAARRSELFDRSIDPRDIDLHEDAQWRLLEELGGALEGFPWDTSGVKDGRYRFAQEMFGRGEALILVALLLAKCPRRFVEVGGGWSTALVLDVREFALTDLEITCIEPFPQRLVGLTGTPERSGIRLIEQRLELAEDLALRSLRHNDILFVDSSHVGKIGSDLLHILFETLPSLSDGVLIHFHDIPWPFEYWEDWIFEGWAWNEAYYLRAFLTHNSRYSIYLWPHMLMSRDDSRYRRLVPQANGDPGSSIWIRKSGERAAQPPSDRA